MSATSIRDPLLLAKSAAVERFLKTAKPRLTFTASMASARPEHNVVGVGVGSKLVEGRSTDQKCVRFYVERKVNKDAIPPDYVLPERIGDIETDVIETGRFRAFQLRWSPRNAPVIRAQRCAPHIRVVQSVSNLPANRPAL